VSRIKKDKIINVGKIEEIFPNKKDIDLEKEGYDKLLGGGKLNTKMKIKVDSASEKAIEKIKEKGGEVVLPKIPQEKVVEEQPVAEEPVEEKIE